MNGGRAIRIAVRWNAWLARERAFALWAHGASSRPWIVHLLSAVSRIGDGWIWYACTVSLPLIGGAQGHAVGLRLFLVGLLNLVVVSIIKRWIARPRPSQTSDAFHECARALDQFSFPSGHTLHAVACSVILTAYYPLAAFVVWPFTILIAASRIILGLHFPSDVIVGAAIGATTAIVSFNLL